VTDVRGERGKERVQARRDARMTRRAVFAAEEDPTDTLLMPEDFHLLPATGRRSRSARGVGFSGLRQRVGACPCVARCQGPG
jgi:hypothetical protein